MTKLVEPKAEFRSLAEDAVVSALQDPDPANPIAVEVARLIAAYSNNFKRHVERLGRVPPDILRIKPRWPIEGVAMRLTTTAIRETLARPAPEKSLGIDQPARARSAERRVRTCAQISRPDAARRSPGFACSKLRWLRWRRNGESAILPFIWPVGLILRSLIARLIWRN